MTLATSYMTVEFSKLRSILESRCWLTMFELMLSAMRAHRATLSDLEREDDTDRFCLAYVTISSDDLLVGLSRSVKHSNGIVIATVFTNPEFRRRGIATMCVDVLTHLYPNKTIMIEPGSEDAVRIYTRLGFEYTSNSKPYMIFNQRKHSSLCKKPQ